VRGVGKCWLAGDFLSNGQIARGTASLVNERVTPELLGRLLDEQGGALALFAAQWSDAPDDCVQEALIELAAQPRVPESPVAWLFHVVRNRAISQFRAARRRERREQLAMRLRLRQNATTAEPIDAEELAAAIQSLEGEVREVVVARTWGGLNFEQIAELVGCSTSTAHRRYEAGLAALRERLLPACPANSHGKAR
jgi:RNA polymerase sigma factor (sigma-70 family)